MIGPLVVSVVSIKEGKTNKLIKIGVRDSKFLTRKKMFFLYDEIYSLAEDVKTYAISNTEINETMKNHISINELEAFHFAKLIDELETEPKRVYLDSPDVKPERFGHRISLLSKKQLKVAGMKGKKGAQLPEQNPIKVISEHKADSRYPVVSTASIIAKVTREREMEKIREKLGIDIGSGYPSDKYTIDAIRNNLKNSKMGQYIREYWGTVRIVRQSRIDDFIS